MHSLSVFETMVEQYFEEGDSMESFAICGLLHDVCKAQFYKVSSRNVKIRKPDAGKPSRFIRLKTSFHTGMEKNPCF